MQGLILAAGMGKRLKSLTAHNTKCMVKVNGVTMIERALAQLDRLGLTRIVIVVGYEGDKLKDYISTLDVATPIEFVDNPIYDRTNNIYSLALAAGQLQEDDTVLLESDLIFEEGVLSALVDDPRPTLALVDKYESWMDGTVVTLDDDDSILSFVPGKRFRFEDMDRYYKTVNIYKFSKEFSRNVYVPFLKAYSQALGNNEYYEQVLRVITMVDTSEILAKRLSGQKWYEIDDLQDLDIAESMFAVGEEVRTRLVASRYGGYWRYPHLVDFCYLVNPYYPPARLMDEMKASFETLVIQYPSGMRVNSLLAAKNFGLSQEHVVVGNGAAELIKALFENPDAAVDGPCGHIRPTFEEYPNRGAADAVTFVPDDPDFAYTADDVIAFFSEHPVSQLVLINPDNPTGNYLPVEDVCRVAQWCEDQGVRLVYDESFADFADEPHNSFLAEERLARYPHMVVVKSISKSYGVPGLRLGIVASADERLIGALKGDVAIWNINSLAEFYLQIVEKYKDDYARSLDKLRAERARFAAALAEVPHVRVMPSQANYLFVELTGAMGASELTERLLCERGLFIKDLSAKVVRDGRQFVRIAVRDQTDDDALVAALHEYLG